MTHFHTIIGADGSNSSVQNNLEFQYTSWNSGRSIGITTNFVNTNTPDEMSLREMGILKIYGNDKSKVPFTFDELKEKKIVLENFVYYRGPTHYFVFTPTVNSLIDFGVLRRPEPVMSDLLSPKNIDLEKLQELARTVATIAKLPTSCKFVDEDIGKPDIAIFDFSGKKQATCQAKFATPEGGPLAILCGDALVEPFWPTGTGANRAILSALDAAWIIKSFAKQGRLNVSFRGALPVISTKLIKKWHSYYQVMRSVEPGDLVSNYSLHTIEPATRYKNLKKQS